MPAQPARRCLHRPLWQMGLVFGFQYEVDFPPLPSRKTHKPSVVSSCRLVTDGTSQSLRYGYGEMASHRDAERALLLQLKTFGMTALEEFRIVHCLPPVRTFDAPSSRTQSLGNLLSTGSAFIIRGSCGNCSQEGEECLLLDGLCK